MHPLPKAAGEQEEGVPVSEEKTFDLSLEQVADYEFRVRFDDTAIPDLVTDETSPLGHDAGPNPSRMLVAAVGNCLAASLLFALRKFHNSPAPITAHVRTTLARNDKGRWRIAAIDVDLGIEGPVDGIEYLERVLAQFEDFCIVTQSVREGIPVEVRVRDGEGRQLHPSP